MTTMKFDREDRFEPMKPDVEVLCALRKQVQVSTYVRELEAEIEVFRREQRKKQKAKHIRTEHKTNKKPLKQKKAEVRSNRKQLNPEEVPQGNVAKHKESGLMLDRKLACKRAEPIPPRNKSNCDKSPEIENIVSTKESTSVKDKMTSCAAKDFQLPDTCENASSLETFDSGTYIGCNDTNGTLSSTSTFQSPASSTRSKFSNALDGCCGFICDGSLIACNSKVSLSLSLRASPQSLESFSEVSEYSDTSDATLDVGDTDQKDTSASETFDSGTYTGSSLSVLTMESSDVTSVCSEAAKTESVVSARSLMDIVGNWIGNVAGNNGNEKYNDNSVGDRKVDNDITNCESRSVPKSDGIREKNGTSGSVRNENTCNLGNQDTKNRLFTVDTEKMDEFRNDESESMNEYPLFNMANRYCELKMENNSLVHVLPCIQSLETAGKEKDQQIKQLAATLHAQQAAMQVCTFVSVFCLLQPSGLIKSIYLF